MNYHNITKADILNGPGLRVVLWVSGCAHDCRNCHNPETHDPESGIPFDLEAVVELMTSVRKNYIEGITYSGGDPLYPRNRVHIAGLSQAIRLNMPEKTQWLYTGYTFEKVLELAKEDRDLMTILSNIDVIVDGKFHQSEADNSLHWKGSNNQRIINVKDSIKEGKIIEFIPS